MKTLLQFAQDSAVRGRIDPLEAAAQLAALNAKKESLRAQVTEAKKRLSSLEAKAELAEVTAISREKLVAKARKDLAQGLVRGFFKRSAEKMVAEEDARLRAEAEAKAAASKPAAVAPKAAPVAAAPKKTLFQQYQALQKTNPAAAGRFWNQHEKDIIAGK